VVLDLPPSSEAKAITSEFYKRNIKEKEEL